MLQKVDGHHRARDVEVFVPRDSARLRGVAHRGLHSQGPEVVLRLLQPDEGAGDPHGPALPGHILGGLLRELREQKRDRRHPARAAAALQRRPQGQAQLRQALPRRQHQPLQRQRRHQQPHHQPQRLQKNHIHILRLPHSRRMQRFHQKPRKRRKRRIQKRR